MQNFSKILSDLCCNMLLSLPHQTSLKKFVADQMVVIPFVIRTLELRLEVIRHWFDLQLEIGYQSEVVMFLFSPLSSETIVLWPSVILNRLFFCRGWTRLNYLLTTLSSSQQVLLGSISILVLVEYCNLLMESFATRPDVGLT